MTVVAYNNLKVMTDSATSQLHISLTKNGNSVSETVDTKDAAKIAGMILAAARKGFADSGRPLLSSSKNDPLDLTLVSPSGHTLGPGRTPDSLTLVLLFGDTVLGIEFQNTDAQILGQRLVTQTADEANRQ